MPSLVPIVLDGNAYKAWHVEIKNKIHKQKVLFFDNFR